MGISSMVVWLETAVRHSKAWLAVALVAAAAVSPARAQATSTQIVEDALRKQWAPVISVTGGQKKSVTVHSVKLGKPAKAALSDVGIDGVPQGAVVTPALVDFTVREYYSTETQAVRRVHEVKVFKNAFDEWALLSGSAQGPDVRTSEPAVK